MTAGTRVELSEFAGQGPELAAQQFARARLGQRLYEFDAAAQLLVGADGAGHKVGHLLLRQRRLGSFDDEGLGHLAGLGVRHAHHGRVQQVGVLQQHQFQFRRRHLQAIDNSHSTLGSVVVALYWDGSDSLLSHSLVQDSIALKDSPGSPCT